MKYNKQFRPLLPLGDALPPSKLLASIAWVGQAGSFSSLWVLVWVLLVILFTNSFQKPWWGLKGLTKP